MVRVVWQWEYFGLCVDLGTMIADVMHPELVSLQPYYGIEDFMDIDEVAPLRHGWFAHQTAAITVLLCIVLEKFSWKMS